MSPGTMLAATVSQQQSPRQVIPRQRMSVEKRFRIIRALDQGMSRNQVIEKFALKHSSNITTILKNKAAIVREMQKGTRVSAKAIRSQKFPMIDQALKRMIEQLADAGVAVSRNMLSQKALLVARKFGVYYRYKMTRGYLDKFLAQYGHTPILRTPDQRVKGKAGSPLHCQLDSNQAINESRSQPARESVHYHQSDLKQILVRSLRIGSMHFMNRLGQTMCHRMQRCSISVRDFDVVQREKSQLLDELIDSLNSVFRTLHDLRDTESTVFVEIASDMMQHHLALTGILVSQFFQTLGRLSCNFG